MIKFMGLWMQEMCFNTIFWPQFCIVFLQHLVYDWAIIDNWRRLLICWNENKLGQDAEGSSAQPVRGSVSEKAAFGLHTSNILTISEKKQIIFLYILSSIGKERLFAAVTRQNITSHTFPFSLSTKSSLTSQEYFCPSSLFKRKPQKAMMILWFK